MKEIISKKMKAAGVLLIAVLMILSTVVVAADTNNESPEFMSAGADYISQPQQTNTFDPDWIHFDDGTNVDALGLTAGGTFEFGIRITPTELAEYDTWELTTIKWYHGVASHPQPSHSGTIKIYDAGTSTSPGALLTSEAFTTAASSDWETTTLSNTVIIDASKDIWVTIEVTHATGEYPAGMDPGPAIDGKGDWLYLAPDPWQEIKDLGFNYNWNIWVKLEMPLPTLEIGNVTGGLFKVSTVIKNTGSVDLTEVNWSITLTGGIILLGKETSDSISSIPAGEETTISSRLVIGFGKTMITVSAETAEFSAAKEQEAFVVLFFIKI